MGKRNAAKRRMETPADFTDARRNAFGYAPVQITERGQVVGRTVRRQCPAMRWEWLGDRERAALVRYWDLAQECEVSVNGCLTPKTGGDGSPVGAERRMMRRSELDALRRSCTAPALAFTNDALLGDAPPHLDALADMRFGSPRVAARMTARAMIGVTAGEMARWFGA
jgi:hypothetical protein